MHYFRNIIINGCKINLIFNILINSHKRIRIKNDLRTKFRMY
jgi:hypothetical protein